MAKTTLCKEVIVTCPNKVGTLAKVTTALAEAKVNVDACCCYTQDGTTCNFHLVTSDTAKTTDLCKKAGWTCKENAVVCCELNNKPGTLADAANKLAQAGVDTEYCWATTGNGSTTKVFFCTKDNNKAAKVLG
jgi:hypothetical protein